jgi:hypothetical protein
MAASYGPSIAPLKKSPRYFSRFRRAFRSSGFYDGSTDPACASRDTGSRFAKEAPMKELSMDEVMAIAGGMPTAATLDEIFYRLPLEPAADPVEASRDASIRVPSPEAS